MFSSIGWGEIFVIVVLGVIIVGPERLPGLIGDVRAAIYAARKAIDNAKSELNGELTSLGAEFEVFREPLSTAAEWGRLGPKGVITKALFEGDESVWDSFSDTKPVAAAPGQTVPPVPATPQPPTSGGFDYSQIYADPQAVNAAPVAPPVPVEQPAPVAQPVQVEQPVQVAQPVPVEQPAQVTPPVRRRRRQPGLPDLEPPAPAPGAGFSWADIT